MKIAFPASLISFGLMFHAATTLASPAGTTAHPPTDIGVYSTVQQTSGAMLGGIGTGFVELCPDGCVHDWSIFNRGHWGYRQDFWKLDAPDRLPLAEMTPDALQFYIRACPTGGQPVVRRLGLIGAQDNVYSSTWLQNVDGIVFDQTFPGATLRYDDSTLPVQVTGKFYGPVIPHDLKQSGTPGFYAIFTIRNTSSQTQDVSLASYLRNPLATGGDAASRGASPRKLHTTVVTDKDTTYLTMRTDSDMPFKSTLGSMCLSISGGAPSWIAMDFRDFLLGRTLDLLPWNQRYETSMNGFRAKGVLPGGSQQPCPTALGPLTVGGGRLPTLEVMPDLTTGKNVKISADVAKLTDDEVKEIIAQARAVPSLNSVVEQAQSVDPTYLDPAKNGRQLVDILRQAVGQYAGVDGNANTWGDGMLSSTLTLTPGEEKQVRIILSWYFPTHLSPDTTRNMGHMYSTWFKDAEEVNRFLATNDAEITAQVDAFHQIFRESNLPPALLASIADQLTTFVSSSWWNEDGKMALWEGLGCCGLNSATVIEQGSHPIVALFPEFEKNWTALATTYQNPTTGRMYIVLPSDLDKGAKAEGYGYVDRNCQFVWTICRDYLWMGDQRDGGDKQYLKDYYPAVVKSLGVFQGMDTDGDGLPDKYTESNTYDTWPLQGVPSYFCSLWIGALRCGIRMADDAGDTANAAKWRAILDKAQKSFEAKLWNGEYYSLDILGDQRDEACMTDQLAGEYYTHLMGLGYGVPQERVNQVLTAIYKYNFDPDQGLWNATYPPGRQPHMPTYNNVQANSNWAGIEYGTAAMLIDNGMVEQGMSIVKAVQQRYLRGGRFTNAEECGPHYTRPLSVWAVLLAATGFKVDAPKGILTIAPPLKMPEMRAPWVSATGWGSFKRTDTTFDLSCRNGDAYFTELRLNVSPITHAELDGQALTFTSESKDGLTILHFSHPVTIKARQTLALR